MSYIWHSLCLVFRFLLLFDIIIKCGSEPLSPRSIRTKYGVVRGVLRHYNKQNVPELPSPLSHLPDKFSIEIFRSVPFAQPAIANLRFLPPVTQTRWRGTKLSNRFLPVCMQNTAEIASSDRLSTPAPVNTSSNKDKIHEYLSTSTLSSVTSSSLESFKSLSNNLSESISGPSFTSNNKNLKRTKRALASIRYGNVHELNRKTNSSTLLNVDLRSTRSTDEFDDKFDRNFISNLLRIHPAYLRPFASYIRNQNEDCLYLNLYVPYEENVNHEQYPVIVFVHGESYEWGTGNAYDGSILADIGKVIVVTLNYRLGVFGFMPSLIEGAVRTNHGLLDVVAYLHWIQDNIAQFGGSAANVQLIGHQRGAALVQFLMKSQLSKGLFQRAVLLSGSASSDWALAEQTEFYTRILASKMDCGLESRTTPRAGDNFSNLNDEITGLFRSTSRFSNQTVNHQLSNADKEIFQCHRSRSSEQLRTASIRLTSSHYSPFRSLFGPTVDSLLITDDQLQSFSYHLNHHSNYSNHLNRKSKFAIINSNHDLLIGYSANSPRFRLALKQMLKTLAQLSNKSGLHFFYMFLRDFVRHVNSLIRDESLNDHNDFDEISILLSELPNLPPSVNLKSDFNVNSNATNWLWKKQDDLLNIINILLLDVLIVAPLFSTANAHQPGSVYTFFLPYEQAALCVLVLWFILLYTTNYSYTTSTFRSIKQFQYRVLEPVTVPAELRDDSLVDLDNFRYVVKHAPLCKTSTELRSTLLIMIHTARNNFEQRYAIRNTWGYIRVFKEWHLHLIFLLGIDSKSDPLSYAEKRLTDESDEYGDMIMGNFVDSYKNLMNLSKTCFVYGTKFG